MVQPGRDQAVQFLAGEIKPRVGHGDAFGGRGQFFGDAGKPAPRRLNA